MNWNGSNKYNDDIKTDIADKVVTKGIFVRLPKMFYPINQPLLLNELSSYGVRGILL